MVEYLVEPILKSKVHMGGTLITKIKNDDWAFMQNAFLFLVNLRSLSQDQRIPLVYGSANDFSPLILIFAVTSLKRGRSI